MIRGGERGGVPRGAGGVCGHNEAAAHLFQSKGKRMQFLSNDILLSAQSVCQALEIGNAVIDSGFRFRTPSPSAIFRQFVDEFVRKHIKRPRNC